MTAPSTPAARPDPRVGSDLGPYHIDRLIGRGGMGVVYLATHTGLERRVALKLLSADLADDADFRARFLREAKLAASIDHPNIIPVYDAGQAEGTLYLAMRFVEGTDLATRLRAGPLAPRAAVSLLAGLAAALDTAHAAGLVHRDVKPANVLIAAGIGADHADHPYLTDFGLTKQRDARSSLTRAGGFLGTLEYVAPEQIESRDVDGRADQYSLACVAVDCLTGQPPFPRESDVALINAHLRDAPPSLHDRRPELPGAADAVIVRAMAKDPSARYPDCGTFVDALRAGLGVGASEPRTRPSLTYQPRRRTGLTLAAGAAMIGAVILAAAMLNAGGVGLLAGSPGASRGGEAASGSARGDGAPSPSASLGAFPNAEEQALLEALPADLARTCERGSSEPIAPVGATGASGGWAKTPMASLRCRPNTATGANEVLVRRFPTVADATTDTVVEYLAGRRRAPSGDCSLSALAQGRWAVGGKDTGAILCYVDDVSGDAILYWSYLSGEILVKATNQRGETGVLYSFFRKYAPFITP